MDATGNDLWIPWEDAVEAYLNLAPTLPRLAGELLTYRALRRRPQPAAFRVLATWSKRWAS